MAIKHSTGLRNAILTSGIATLFDTNGQISIYSGTVPSGADDAANGTLLAVLPLSSDAMGSASSGAISFASITSDASANASGTAQSACVHLTTETALSSGAGATDKRLWLSVGTSGEALNFDNNVFVEGGTVAISSFSYTYPA